MNHEKIYQDLHPELATLEELRLKCRRKAWLAIPFFVVGTIVGFLIEFGSKYFQVLQKPDDENNLGLFIGGAICAVGAAIWKYHQSVYEKEVKLNIIPIIVKTVTPGITYDGLHHVEEVEYNKSRLFDYADRYRGEDLLHGQIGQTAFKISEIHSERKVKSGKKTKYTTIFKGIFLVADFNKHFQGITKVLPEGRTFLSKKPSRFSRKGLELVELEDISFEKEFAIYGSDQTEARYILSTSLMERILNLRKRWDSPTYLSFIEGSVYLAIKTDKDFFHVSFYRPITVDNIRIYLEELLDCVDIIEELNLNLRIWSKQ